MKLTEEQVQALVAWADQADDPNGLSGWGVLFDGAMQVAREVRKADAADSVPKTENAANSGT